MGDDRFQNPCFCDLYDELFYRGCLSIQKHSTISLFLYANHLNNHQLDPDTLQLLILTLSLIPNNSLVKVIYFEISVHPLMLKSHSYL